MSLESLLQPLKWADEQVLRQYSELAKQAEKKGWGNKYQLATILNGGSSAMFLSTLIASPVSEYWAIYGGAFVGLLENMCELVLNAQFAREEVDEELEQTKALSVEKIKSVYRLMRLPALAGGITQLGLGMSNLYYFFFEGGGTSTGLAGITGLVFGASLSLWSSAMYFRDTDPACLDKDLLSKRVYEWCKDKFRTLGPHPIPEPVLLEADPTIDGYVRL